MENYINCCEAEIKYLKKEYEYWNSYVAEGMAGNLGKTTKLTRIKKRLNELNSGKVAPHYLSESSLSRIWQHVEQNPNTSWALISPDRKGTTPEERKKRHKVMQQAIRSQDLGYIPVEGRWKECQDTSVDYDECPEDKLIDVKEDSYFIPNIPKGAAHKLGNAFDQDAVVYGGPDTDNSSQLVFRNGETLNLGAFNPDTIASAYSRIKGGRTFAFGDRNEPDSSIAPRDFAGAERNRKDKIAGQTKKMDANQQFKVAAGEVRTHKIMSSVSGKPIHVGSALKKDHPDRQTAINYIRKWLDSKKG